MCAEFTIDFDKPQGIIKPLHGICNSRDTFGEPMPELKAAGIPFVRLHDMGGPYGGNRLVDVPNLFRDFDAAPEDPNAYDFAFTDAYFKGLTASVPQLVYRLGVTIENECSIKACRIHPPKDNLKWAKICAGIIRHYNYGWANGFHYNIQYWEIWNEPENPQMWTGTRQQYFELYRVAANYLKSQFPEIKIGGYASCGFYAVDDPKATDFYKGFVTWFTDFLDYIKAPATHAPIDFFSWHIYFYDENLQRLVNHANFVRTTLDERGFGNVEDILDEWNYVNFHYEDWADREKEMPGATCVAAAFCLLQRLGTSKAMYYDARANGSYGGIYYSPSERVSKTYYVFKMFNELYKLGNAVECTAPNAEEVYILAATRGSRHAALLVNRTPWKKDSFLRVKGATGLPKVTVLDKCRIMTIDPTVIQEEHFQLPGESVLLLEW